MVAPRKYPRIVCTVVAISVPEDSMDQDLGRPSNRLPWADPTIAQLVNNLQDEIRNERRRAKLEVRVGNSAVADLDPPSPLTETEPDWPEQPRWTWPE